MPDTVLVVDADREAEVARACLSRSSYRVLTADGGDRALEILQSESRIELVAAELRLPGTMSGVALISRIRVTWPATSVMLMTKDRQLPIPGIPILTKPFTAAALVQRVEQLIADHRRTADSLATAFEWNRAAKEELESVRKSLQENIRQSRQRRVERFCSRLNEPGAISPTVLVAEDDDALRYAVCRFLSVCRFQVLEARNGIEALEISGRHAGRIDLVLTDFHLPGMNGVDVVDSIRAERPETRVLVMTSDDNIFPYRTVRKPFELDSLLADIIGVLVAPGQAASASLY